MTRSPLCSCGSVLEDREEKPEELVFYDKETQISEYRLKTICQACGKSYARKVVTRPVVIVSATDQHDGLN